MNGEEIIGSIRKARSPQEASLTNVSLIMTTGDGGRVLQTPNGLQFVSPGYSTSDPAKIAEIMRQAEAEGGKTPRSMVSSELQKEMVEGRPFTAGALKLSQGIPFIGEYIPEMVGLLDPEMQRGIERLQKAKEAQDPVSSAGLRIAGAVAPSLLFPGSVAATSGVPAQMVRGGLMAGGEAAVSGFGAGEGGVESRAKNALKEGAIGFGFGSTLSGAISAFTKGTQGTRNIEQAINSISKELNVSKGAAAIIGQTLGNGGNIDDAIRAIRRAGDSGMLADADIAAAYLLDAVIATGDKAATIGRGAVEGRASSASARLSGIMDEAFGPSPVGMQTVAEAASARTKDARQAAYEAAYQSPIDYASDLGQQLEQTLLRVPESDMKKAMEIAEKYMKAEGKGSPQFKVIFDDNGAAEIIKQPNVIELDYLKRGLQDVAYGNYADNFGRPSGLGITLNNLASDIRTKLGQLVPEYDQAVRLGGDKIREVAAGQVGNVMFKNSTTVEEVMMAVRGASKTELDALKLGARNQINEAMGNAKSFITTGGDSNVQAAKTILRDLSSVSSRQKLELLLGPQEYQRLAQKIDEVRSSLELLANTAPNSRTAPRLELKKQMDELIAPGVAGTLARGEPVASGKAIIQALTGMTDDALIARKNEILSEVAGVLTGIQGRDAVLALKYVRDAMDKGAISQAKANYVNRILQGVAIPAAAEAPSIGNE